VLRVGPLALLVLLASACGGNGDGDDGDGVRTPPPAPATNLQIQIWPQGRDGPFTMWTLTCPGGGSLPNAEEACRRLSELGDRAFAPTPKDMACAEIFGGPQVAEVRGTFDGAPVQARFSRNDACEMERWKRVEFLFAESGPT
jgi:hypothetical protein